MPTLRRRTADYLNFLDFAHSIPETVALPALDPLEGRIFRRVARAGFEKERLSVKDLRSQPDLGAPTTIHFRLKSMRKKGWIALADTDDARRKQIVLTEAALLVLDAFGIYLMELAKV